jgi:hypothetical protein
MVPVKMELTVDIYYRKEVDSEAITEWLERTIPHWTLSPSRRSAFDELQRIVYGIYASTNRVYIRDQKYAHWFILKWG